MILKATSAFLSFICGLALLIFLLISSFGMAAFYDIDYFGYEFEKNSIDKVTGYSIEKLENEAQLLLDYMLLDEAEEEFQNSTFFNEREKLHMKDVKDIVQSALNIRRVCMVLIAVSLGAVIIFRLNKFVFIKFFALSFGLIGILFYILAGVSVLNFNKAFIIFHEVLFNNDLWLLDPRESLMINMLPESFFVDTFVRVCLTFSVLWAVIFFVSIHLIKRLRHDGAGD